MLMLAWLVLSRTVVPCLSLPTLVRKLEQVLFVLQNIVIVLFLVCSQKASIAELKAQLDEERNQRREEREKAAADLKAAVQKAQLEAEEEIKRFSDAATRRQREQQEVINKLQVWMLLQFIIS